MGDFFSGLLNYIRPYETYGLNVLFIFIFVGTVSYLIGAIPNGYIIGKKIFKTDLTKYGSGNIGATNVLRVLGTKPALTVLFLDFLEGFFPVLLSKIFFKSVGFSIFAGFLSALGHDFSIFMPMFKGGKGVATSFGVITAVQPLISLLGVITFFIVFFFGRIVSLSSLVSSLLVPLFFYLFAKNKMASILMIPFAVLVFISHRENIKRLLSGKEKKFSGKTIKK